MTGKNIPCPCGSGKSYSRCCGTTSNVVSLNQVRLRKTGQNLRRKLGDYVGRQEFAKDAARAQELYFRHLDAEISDFDDEFLMERCFEWFIFDFRLPAGDRIIDRFKHESHLDRNEKELLEGWFRASNSLYEVKAVLPGKLLLEDVFLRDQMVVTDTNAVREITAGFILYMRVLPVGEENEFSTSGLALPGSCRSKLLKRLFTDAFRFWENGSFAEDWGAYLRERSHVVNGIVMQITADPGLEWPDPGETDGYSEELEGEMKAARGGAVPEDFPWREARYQLVAREVTEELYSFKCDSQQVGNALRMWYDYTSMERPVFRKPAAWVATIVYAILRLERVYNQNQNLLAEKYGVSPSTVSEKYRSLVKILNLKDRDERYSTGGRPGKLRRVSNTVSFLSHFLSKRK